MAKKLAIEVEIKNIKRVADLKAELKALRKEQVELEKLSKTGRFTSKKQEEQYIKNSRAIKDKSTQLRNLNKNLRESTTNTTKATKASNGMAKQIVKGAAAIGVIVTAFRTVNRVVSSVVTTFTEFEFVMAKVNAISGATEQEFAALSNSAQELGRTTFFTAEQVGQLQLNFSKLGFSAQEIMKAQKPTLALATATGSDLARSATVAASAIRGFGLDASETQRVVDVMAVAFSSSALDIEKFQTSMTKVAPIAKSAGFSIEDTTAIMAKLSDAGIEASIAGTSLRNILLKMQDPNSDLVKSFGKTIHSLDELIPAMKQFREEGGKMADVLEVVDLRQAAAFEIMLAGSDILSEYRNNLKGSSGEAQRMADIVANTLQGSFLKLKSALEGVSISIMENFAEGLKEAGIRLAAFGNFLSKNSETVTFFIRAITKLIKVIGLYKLGVIGASTAMTAYNRLLVLKRAATIKATTATLTFAGALQTVKGAFTSLMSRTGIGLLVVVLGELASKFLFASDAAEEYSNEQDKIMEQQEDFIKLALKDLAHTKKASEENIKALDKAIKMRELEAWAIQDSLDSKQITDEFERKAAENRITNIKREIETLELRKKQEKELQDERDNAAAEEARLKNDLIAIQEKELELAKQMPGTTQAEIIARNRKIDTIQKEIDKLNELGRVRETSDLFGPKTFEQFNKEFEENQIKLEQQQVALSEEYFKKQVEKAEQRIQMIQEFSNSMFTIIGNNAQRKANAEAKLLEERKEAGIITEEQYEKQLEQVQRKAFERKKRLDIAQAIINGALAMTQTAANVGFPLQFVFSPFVAAMTAAQIAVIASQKFAKGGVLEKFANGGMVHGKSHAQGGEKFAVGGRVVELEGGEAVINKRSTAMFRNQLSAMNAAGGGVKFADGGLMNMPSFAQSQFNAVSQQSMMGAIGQSNRVVVVEADITKSQNTVSLIEAEATF
jgi:TP901 family phage tail tape measure protein